MTVQSTAMAICDALDGDGTVWVTDGGRTFDQLVDEHGGVREERQAYLGVDVRYVFADGSALIAMPEAWDIRDPACEQYCCEGVGCTCCRHCGGSGEVESDDGQPCRCPSCWRDAP